MKPEFCPLADAEKSKALLGVAAVEDVPKALFVEPPNVGAGTLELPNGPGALVPLPKVLLCGCPNGGAAGAAWLPLKAKAPVDWLVVFPNSNGFA